MSAILERLFPRAVPVALKTGAGYAEIQAFKRCILHYPLE